MLVEGVGKIGAFIAYQQYLIEVIGKDPPKMKKTAKIFTNNKMNSTLLAKFDSKTYSNFQISIF